MKRSDFSLIWNLINCLKPEVIGFISQTTFKWVFRGAFHSRHGKLVYIKCIFTCRLKVTEILCVWSGLKNLDPTKLSSHTVGVKFCQAVGMDSWVKFSFFFSIDLLKWNFWWKGVLIRKSDFKNGYKNEFDDHNDKIWS